MLEGLNLGLLLFNKSVEFVYLWGLRRIFGWMLVNARILYFIGQLVMFFVEL